MKITDRPKIGEIYIYNETIYKIISIITERCDFMPKGLNTNELNERYNTNFYTLSSFYSYTDPLWTQGKLYKQYNSPLYKTLNNL